MNDDNIAEGNIEPRGEEDDSDDVEKEVPHSPFRQAVAEVTNISLLHDSYETFAETDWYAASLTSFHLGYLGLLVWSVYLTFAMGVVYLSSSQSLVGATSRIFTIGPLAPVAVFLFAAVSNQAVEGMKNAHTTEEPDNPAVIPLVTISIFALVTAAAYRWALYSTLHDIYGSTLFTGRLVTVMVLDGLHISLILMGLGGLASLITAPPSE